MPHLHNHRQSHSHSPAGETAQGNVLHSAHSYDKLAGLLLKRSEARLVRLAGIKPGDRVLDLGCGPGSLTLEAKRQAGPSGQVYGLDASPEMIELAGRKAREAGLEVNFLKGLAQQLPFEDGCFDVVLSRLAVHHFPVEFKEQAFREMRRVLKPGGYCFLVDFDLTTLPLPGLLLNRLSRLNGMLKVDVREYTGLLEQSGFTGVGTGRTGHMLLSWAAGHTPA